MYSTAWIQYLCGQPKDICVEWKTSLKFIILHRGNAIEANQQPMVRYEIFKEVHPTACLQRCCGRPQKVCVERARFPNWLYCMAAMLLRSTNSWWHGMKTSMKCILLHGCTIFAVNQQMFEWKVNVLKCMTLPGCNVFVVNPKIFVCNVNPSSAFYCMPAMLRLQCYGVQPTAEQLMVWYENFKEMHAAACL